MKKRDSRFSKSKGAVPKVIADIVECLLNYAKAIQILNHLLVYVDH